MVRNGELPGHLCHPELEGSVSPVRNATSLEGETLEGLSSRAQARDLYCAHEAILSDLRSKLSWVVPGDLVHGRDEGQQSWVCLVESVGPERIEARRITTQEHLAFDSETGANIDAAGCRLDSIMPLPLDVHDVLLGLDRKMRLGNRQISAAEKAALDFATEVYRAHPLGTTGRRGRKST